MPEIRQFNYKNHWQELEIILERSQNDGQSLGFSIDGGIDTRIFDHHFPAIIVMKIIENGLAHKDKQLKLYDVILRVNNVDFKNIKKQAAIDILRTSGQKVQLLIHRLSPPIVEEIELEQHGEIGITITGGIGNEYCQNDHGIFIMNIDKHLTNGGLELGDRLLQISSGNNTYDLRFVTHKNAIQCIQSVCAESRKIKLCVGHARPVTQVESKKTVLHQGQYDPHESRFEDSTVKNQNIKTENHQTIQPMFNGRYSKKRDDGPLIMKFDYDDYQRYENRNRGRLFYNRLLDGRTTKSSEALLEQQHGTKFTIAPTVVQHGMNASVNRLNLDQHRNFTVNNSHQYPVNDQRAAQEVRVKETTIRDAAAEKLRRQEAKFGQSAPTDRNGGLRWQVD